MRSWNAAGRYYAITLTASIQRRLIWSVQSHFVGPSDQRRGWEVREASIVDATNMVGLWDEIGQSWLAVDGRVELALWVRLGGNALVAADLAEEHLARMVAPREVAPRGPIGFLTASSLSEGQLARRPSRTVRDRVFERDGHACRRCGSGSATARLTRHHVLPRSAGGLTQENNLVTLCEACHEASHADDTWCPAPDLQGVLLSHELDGLDEDHDEAVARHRRLVAALYA